MYYLALFFLFFAFLIQLCRHNGLARLHFHWREATCQALKGNLRWLLALETLPFFLIVATDFMVEPVYGDTVGRVAFAVYAIVLAVFGRRLFHPSRGALAPALVENLNTLWWRLRYLWYLPLFTGWLFLAILALLGYYYAALALASLLLQSIVLLVGVGLGVLLILRAINVAQRRLALARARQRRQALLASREAGEPSEGMLDSGDLEGEEFDVEKLSKQTRDVLRMAANITVLVGLWFIWDDLLPALSLLDQVTLWEYKATGPDGDLLQPITLGKLLVAILIIALTFFLARNLPGILEIAVFATAGLGCRQPLRRHHDQPLRDHRRRSGDRRADARRPLGGRRSGWWLRSASAWVSACRRFSPISSPA